MKFLLFAIITMLLVAPSVFCQTRKAGKPKSKRAVQAEKRIKDAVLTSASADEPPMPPPKPAPKLSKNERLSSAVFKDITIGKWGVASLSMPDDLTNETESSEPTVNGNVSWTTYSRDWKQAAEFYPSALEADLTVTTWNADFKTVIPDLKPDLATPENLILVDLLGDFNNKNTPGSFVKEARALEVGGVDGNFFRADAPGDKNRFIVGWGTYRYYQGKAQRISLTVTGKKDELEKALKIIQSLKLQ